IRMRRRTWPRTSSRGGKARHDRTRATDLQLSAGEVGTEIPDWRNAMSLTDMTTKCRGCDGSGDCPACGGKGVRTEEASRDERIKAVVARHRGEYTGAQQE